MFLPTTVLLTLCLYVLLLFGVAFWGDRRARQGRGSNAWVYSLSLAVYCTSWTFYGSVGAAANSGLHFLTVYLGPTLVMVFAWQVIRKMVRLKSRYHITSIADFISSRYQKSQSLAALVTLIAMLGILPYIALQLKAVVASYELISGDRTADAVDVELVTVILMALFTILFGVRHLDPTERHQGMMLALATESLVKLVAFLAAGAYVTFGLFDGFGDLFSRAAARAADDPHLYRLLNEPVNTMSWFTTLILSMSAILLLPRQFHVTVVENSSEQHIRTAQWLFPLYLILINIFVVPIALGGLQLNLDPSTADSFVISVPLAQDQKSLSLLVFIGGFSAATGMILVSAMTLSTMGTNHLLLPLLERIRTLRGLRRYLLQCRWLAVAVILYGAYLFNRVVGDAFMLVNMGLLSFAAVLQFAPALLGGLFWRGATLKGALTGLSLGFLTWGYTLLVPAFVKADMLPLSLLETGWLGIAALRPEQLFGVTSLDPLAHAVFWSLLLNSLGYVLVSLGSRSSEKEQQLAQEFISVLEQEPQSKLHMEAEANLVLAPKLTLLLQTFGQYLNAASSQRALHHCLEATGLQGHAHVSIIQLAYLRREAESRLAGSIGGAASHRAIEASGLFSEDEEQQLSSLYTRLLGQMKLTPEELWSRIDYYQERETMLSDHANHQQVMIDKLQSEVAHREHAEEALRRLNEELEQRVQQRTAQLQASNQDLEDTLQRLRETQAQLVEADKMAALGNLVAGVAHEINTPLGNSLTAASMLQEEATQLSDKFSTQRLTRSDMDNFNDVARETLQIVLQNTGRAAQLVQSFKQVAVDQTSEERRRFQVHEYLEEILFPLHPELRKCGHRVTLEGDDNLQIDSYPGAFSQIVTNLVLNSLQHAFGPDHAGVIQIRFHSDGDQLVLEFSDNGQGMSDEDMARIFDPFFTTCRETGGTGLGAHIVYNLVTQRLRGQIRAEPNPDGGLRFVIQVPLITPEPAETQPAPAHSGSVLK